MSARVRAVAGAASLLLLLAAAYLAWRDASGDARERERIASGPPAVVLPELSREPRHVVLIVADTLRADFVGEGSRAPTPNLDALTARGRSYPNAFASFHQTTMSMGAMFTGRTPSLETGDPARALAWDERTWCGMVRFASEGDACVPAGLVTIAEELHEAGFRTVGVTSNKLLFDPAGFSQGFETWVQVGDGSDLFFSWAGERVNSAVRKALGEAPDERNLFLYVHYMDAHDWSLAEQSTDPKQMAASYRKGVERLDRAVGALLADLADRGVLQEAAVVFVADHGEILGELHLLPTTRTHFGNPSYKQVLRIPLIVAPALDLDDRPLLRTKDVPLIVRRLTGLPTPDTGHPPQLEPDENFTSEQSYLTYRRGQFKSFTPRAEGRTYLVDLEADPRESEDVADRHPEVVEAHRARLAALAETLATGDVGDAVISEEQLQRLRALGYVE